MRPFFYAPEAGRGGVHLLESGGALIPKLRCRFCLRLNRARFLALAAPLV